MTIVAIKIPTTTSVFIFQLIFIRVKTRIIEVIEVTKIIQGISDMIKGFRGKSSGGMKSAKDSLGINNRVSNANFFMAILKTSFYSR